MLRERVKELEAGTKPQALKKLIDVNGLGVFLEPRAGLHLALSEAVILAAAVTPHLQPHLFDEGIMQALRAPADYPRIGGVRGKDSRLFLPTGETVMFLLGARTVSERMEVLSHFGEASLLTKQKMVSLTESAPSEPIISGGLVVGDGVIELVLGLPKRRPKLGPEFPAQRIETELTWEDVILEEQTVSEIEEIRSWMNHGEHLLREWGMNKYLKPGYRALFFGPSGTGKTLAASILGKQTGRDVYRIDLSMIVSKFIGETEKNLARIFDQAEDKDWILFFDEADALFGKRTSVKDAHDRYANQEVSYLLQRVEGFSGLVILASNFRNNIDDAFLRRFQSVIHFPKPSHAERMRLWGKMLPKQATLAENISLHSLCKRHELTGANIANIIQYSSLRAMERGNTQLELADIEQAIGREYEKEGKLG
ncbi:MAG: ATP-binding protein [Akkermansiaceae bacterium]|nr:ATP-binding protein [Akkermansiaceae bacterium]